MKHFLKNLFLNEQQLKEKFLSESIDLIDLENRQRMIERNQAPFQRKVCYI